jgi:hypothetical protein
MFYKPGWFEETEKRTELKQEDLVVAPFYKTWFMAVSKGSSFIRQLKTLFIDTVMSSYEQTKTSMEEKKIELADYLLDQHEFLPWLTRVAVQQKQQQLDQWKSASRKLAISEYKISAIDVT